MLDAGALEEVRALDARGAFRNVAGDEGAWRAVAAEGFPRRDFTGSEAAEGAIMDTRRYAKRQVTWFRNQMPGWVWAKPEEGHENCVGGSRGKDRSIEG